MHADNEAHRNLFLGATTHTHVLYHLAKKSDGRIVATNTDHFSQEEYSKFKHGDERVARKYGNAVAKLLLEKEHGLFTTMPDQVVLASFPYKELPTAAAHMAGYAVNTLNHYLSMQNLRSVGLLHAYKYICNASIDHKFAE